MAESHIDTRTPDEMLDGALRRMTAIAEMVIRTFPRLALKADKAYRYSFDKLATYRYIKTSKDGFFHYLQRHSDGAIMIATKYSESPEEIEQLWQKK